MYGAWRGAWRGARHRSIWTRRGVRHTDPGFDTLNCTGSRKKPSTLPPKLRIGGARKGSRSGVRHITFGRDAVLNTPDRTDYEALGQLGQDEPAPGSRWSHCSGSTAVYRADVSWNTSSELSPVGSRRSIKHTKTQCLTHWNRTGSRTGGARTVSRDQPDPPGWV